MSAKAKSAILSLMAIVLLVLCYNRLKAGNTVISLIFGVLCIVCAVLYFVVSVPDFKKDLQKNKEKKEAEKKD